MAIYSTADLHRAGTSKRRIERLLLDGTLRRVRRGFYCDSDAIPEEVEAVRIGGVLGCVSALRSYEVWVTVVVALHVHLAPNASRLRAGRVIRHWNPLVSVPSPHRVSVLDALLVAMVCQSLADSVASVDSALHRGLVTLTQLRPYCSDARRRRVLQLVDGRAESGLESLIRVALVRAGLRVELQVVIPGVGRVDMLVEGCVVVEADGAAYHSGPRRHEDYVRDAMSVLQGLTAVRYDAAQVHGDLGSIVLAVIEAVRQHRRGPYSGRTAASRRARALRTAHA